MQLVPLDWIVIAVYGAVTVGLGLWFTRRAGQSVADYFVAGRTLPWWLAGTSIAATWFASDAPLAAASLVRQQGIFGNWLWWYEAGGVMLLVFFYAALLGVGYLMLGQTAVGWILLGLSLLGGLGALALARRTLGDG